MFFLVFCFSLLKFSNVLVEAAQYNCSTGCPLEVAAPVCGAGGVTFGNECLAVCSGTAVAYQGVCLAPGAGPPRARGPGSRAYGAATTTPDALADHPLGQFLRAPGAGADAAPLGPHATGGAPVTATAADIRRFSPEGLFLVGPARLGDFEVGGKQQEGPQGLLYSTRNKMEVYRVRVTTDRGLVYASTPILAAARQLVGGAAGVSAASTPSQPPLQPPTPSATPPQNGGGAQQTVPGSANSSGGSDLNGAATGVSGGTAAAFAVGSSNTESVVSGGAVTPAISESQWTEIRELQDGPPLTTIGWLRVGYPDGEAGCSGSLIGNYTVITASHCVYSKSRRQSSGTIRFVAHSFFGTDGYPNQPFGMSVSYGYDYLAGRRADGSLKPWTSDIAVVLLKEGVGGRAGALGFGYDKGGYSGRVWAAGYPMETQRRGQYFRLAGNCTVRDRNGMDGRLRLRAATQTGCFSGCAIAERGQSGQPAYVQGPDGEWVVRAVLSSGPRPGTCRGADTYSEIDALHYSFLEKARNWTPPDS